MSAKSPVWSATEIELILADYFEMWALDLTDPRPNGKPTFEKEIRYRELAKIIGRTTSSVQNKHQNISAVVDKLGLPYIRGLTPRGHFQAALFTAVVHKLEHTPGIEQLIQPTPHPDKNLVTEAAPLESKRATKDEWEVVHLIQQFDPAARDARNRELGALGEQLAFENERKRLNNAHLHDLADRVRWVSRDDGDGAGLDIHSFDLEGNERLLEVKTTRGGARTPFYLTENERRISEQRAPNYYLLRIYNYTHAPTAFELRPPLDAVVNLQATNYRASFP